MKISKYQEWTETNIPNGAYFVFAYNGVDWKVNNRFTTGGGGGTSGGGTNITDYRYNILETPDGIQTIFTLRYNYVPGSCKVYLGGLRQTPNEILGISTDDYDEIGNKQIQFVEAPLEIAKIVVDYLTTDVIEGHIFESIFEERFE